MSLNHRPRNPRRILAALRYARLSRRFWLRSPIDAHNLKAAWHSSDRSYFQRLAMRWGEDEDPTGAVLRPIELPSGPGLPTCVECPECHAEIDTRTARAL